jgi:hypothetical protein
VPSGDLPPTLCRYVSSRRHGSGGLESYTLTGVAPTAPRRPELSARVKAASPTFEEIYAQSVAAEAFELHEIAGGGYRKSLEFLIKDFCIAQYPDAAEKIKQKFLGDVIKEYVDDARLKVVAETCGLAGKRRAAL